MTLDDLLRAGALGPLDVRFAEAMARLGGDETPEVCLGAALASRRARAGHVCADLRAVAGTEVDEVQGDDRPRWPELDGWITALQRSPLVSSPPPEVVPTPLVLDGADRLYLARYWQRQVRLARRLMQLSAAEAPGVDPDGLEQGLARLFPDAGDAQQRDAARTAVRRQLTVISGGPGTGKTATVVRILALIAEQAAARGAAAPTVGLVAPTGKAAARLAESIQDAIESGTRPLDCDPAILAVIPDQASTIHRALGWSATGGFRHDDSRPLAVDLLVVDEASMVDLVLMSRLVDALPAGARLVLLGDKDQLASVEAGAVLGDVCDAASAPSSTLGDSVVHLTRSYRFGRDSGIGRLATAINREQPDEVLALLHHADDLDHLTPTPSALQRAIEPLIIAGFGHLADPGDPAARLAALGRFRILCAHRHGPFGVETLNALAERILSRRLGLDTHATWYPGRPVLITTNDYDLRLFNGDVGLTDRADSGEIRVFFPDPDGSPRSLAPARLPDHDTVFATTIHKSQGSEFDHVLVVLPPSPSPVTTRELLYTAVTRARRHVTLLGPPEVIDHAVRTQVQRASGLGDLLRG